MDDLTVTAIRVDPLRAGNRHPVSLNAIQVVQVLFASDEEGQDNSQVPFQHRRDEESCIVRAAREEFGQGF